MCLEEQTDELDQACGRRPRSGSAGGPRKLDHALRSRLRDLQWSDPHPGGDGGALAVPQCQILRHMVEMYENVRVVEEEELTQNTDGSKRHKRRRTTEKQRGVRVATEIGRTIHQHRHTQRCRRVKTELLQLLTDMLVQLASAQAGLLRRLCGGAAPAGRRTTTQK